MDIHKPKAARNWREFAIEIGTIICGILIALALDQTVEWLHRRSEMAEARQALRSEIAADAGVARYNHEWARCMGALSGFYLAWAKGGPRPPSSELLAPLIKPTTSAWDVAKTGVVARMPLSEELAYSRFYTKGETFLWAMNLGSPVLARMDGELEISALTPPDAQGVRMDARQVQRFTSALALSTDLILQDARALGVTPTSSPEVAGVRDRLTKFCGLVGITPSFD
jgi:hypothetical protein